MSRQILRYFDDVSTHSHPKAAAYGVVGLLFCHFGFQHTAARRRLRKVPSNRFNLGGFNTQPHGGGCLLKAFYSPFIM